MNSTLLAFIWALVSVVCLVTCQSSRQPQIEAMVRAPLIRRSLTLNTDSIGNGVWFNKGQPYPRCSALHYQNMQCSNFSLSESPVSNSRFWKPDCAFLMQRLICALFRTNCPTSHHTSFQMYDIPCQASCYAAVAMCGPQSLLLFGAGNQISTQVGHQDWRMLPSGSSGQSVWPWRPIGSSFDSASSSSSVVLPSSETANMVSSSSQRTRTPPRTPRTSSMHRSYSQWTLREENIPGTRTKRNAPEIESKPVQGLQDNSWLRPDATDCEYLPAGGCDNWASGLTSVHNIYGTDFEKRAKQNVACSMSTNEMCTKMFPQEFTRRNWSEGNFTVALIIRITQAFWWFGGNNRFQPFIRFQVKKTLKTDIQPYDEKVILTYSWPVSCACVNELTVGKRYLLMTHSRISRQNLRITSMSVLLGKVKRYQRKLLCWLGMCPQHAGGGRGRPRRYPVNRWNWRWPAPRQLV